MLCGESTEVVRPFQVGGGSATLTSPLHQFKKKDWWVAPCEFKDARLLIETFHYAKGTSNTRVYSHGLWDRAGNLWGCALWLPPTRSCAEFWAAEEWQGVLSLSRLAISPHVPKNACSFLISKSVRLIDRYRWHTLVSYADQWRGHTGAIYAAAGWTYAGMTDPQAVYTIDGRMTARKAGPKTRTHEEMLALGAKFEGRFSKSRWVLR